MNDSIPLRDITQRTHKSGRRGRHRPYWNNNLKELRKIACVEKESICIIQVAKVLKMNSGMCLPEDEKILTGLYVELNANIVKSNETNCVHYETRTRANSGNV